MTNPSNTPEAIVPDPQAHHCSPNGVPKPYGDPYEFDGDDSLLEVMAEDAVTRIIYALQQRRNSAQDRADQFAKEHLPAERWEEYRRYAHTAVDQDSAISVATIRILVAVVPHLQAISVVSAMEASVTEAMAKGGFCCEHAVDEFIEEMTSGRRS